MRVRSREGVWYAEGYYLEAGKRKRWKRSTGVPDDGTRKSKQAAESIGLGFQQSLAAGENRDARPTTVEQATQKLVASMERAQRAQPTIDIVIEKSVHLFAFFGPKTPCREITADKLENYADWARKPRVDDEGEAIDGRGPATIHRELQTLRQAMKVAGFTPPAMPDLGEVNKPRERWLNLDETAQLLEHVPEPWRDHVVMYRQLGLTKSELYRIEPRDVFWDRAEVRVRGTKTKARDRILPMTAEIAAILKRRKGRSPMFERWGNGNRDLDHAAQKAGLGRLSFNDLRRSFATELASKNVSPLLLMHLMGHSSTRMLEKVYARVGRGQHMHDAVALLGRLDTLAEKRMSLRSAKRGTNTGQNPQNDRSARTPRTVIKVRETSAKSTFTTHMGG